MLPHLRPLLIHRSDFSVLEKYIGPGGHCPDCATPVSRAGTRRDGQR